MPSLDILDPQTLTADLLTVRDAYTALIGATDAASLNRPGKGDPGGWTQREVLAHLGALNGAGIDSVRHTLRGEPYTFEGLDDRYHFNAYNRAGIDRIVGQAPGAPLDRPVAVLEEGARIANGLSARDGAITAPLPIYNRRVRVDETLSIVVLHSGLLHSAQVTEPAGQPPLWTGLDGGVQHRLIGRLMLAFSLLYRVDLADGLRDTVAFRIGGPNGGQWALDLRPDGASWSEASPSRPGVTIRLRDESTMFRMATRRIRVPLALATGEIRVQGHWRLFMGLGRLTSVDARPK